MKDSQDLQAQCPAGLANLRLANCSCQRSPAHLLVPLFVRPIPVLLLASTITPLLPEVLLWLPVESDTPVCKKRGVSLGVAQIVPNGTGE